MLFRSGRRPGPREERREPREERREPREERREPREGFEAPRERPSRAAREPVNVALYAEDDRKRRPPRREPEGQGGSVLYRISVGHEHGVQPGNIVGAIANEAALDSSHIGRIRIFDAYSTVELPEGMPDETFERLQKAWVCGRQLAIQIDSGTGEGPQRLGSRPRGDARRAGPKKHRKGAPFPRDKGRRPR